MLDTLALAKGLTTAGMPQPQAEAISRELATALKSGDLVTKKDLENVAARLRAEIVASRDQTVMAMVAVVGTAPAIARLLF